LVEDAQRDREYGIRSGIIFVDVGLLLLHMTRLSKKMGIKMNTLRDHLKTDCCYRVAPNHPDFSQAILPRREQWTPHRCMDEDGHLFDPVMSFRMHHAYLESVQPMKQFRRVQFLEFPPMRVPEQEKGIRFTVPAQVKPKRCILLLDEDLSDEHHKID
jgi:hypothetical protein